MILAAIPWLSISINLLLVVFVIVCLLMTLLILMQRPKQEGLGAAFGGGVTDQVFGARTTNVLQKGTVYCGTLFFVLALLLAILIGRQNKDSALLNESKPAAEKPAAVVPEESAPDAGSGDQDLPASLLEELPEDDENSGAATDEPEAPEAPEAPPTEDGESTESAEDSSDQAE